MLYVGFGTIKQIISIYSSLGGGRTHDLLATGVALCYIKPSHMFNVSSLLVDVSDNGHHDVLARGIV